MDVSKDIIEPHGTNGDLGFFSRPQWPEGLSQQPSKSSVNVHTVWWWRVPSDYQEGEIKDVLLNPARCPSEAIQKLPCTSAEMEETLFLQLPSPHQSSEATQNRSGIISLPNPKCTLSMPCLWASLLTEQPQIPQAFLGGQGCCSPSPDGHLDQTHITSPVPPLHRSSRGWWCQHPESSAMVLDAKFVLRQPEFPGITVVVGNRRVCLIKLGGSKKNVCISCPAAPWLAKHEFFLLIQYKESVFPRQILTTEKCDFLQLIHVTKFHRNKTIQCSCGYNSVVAIFTQ